MRDLRSMIHIPLLLAGTLATLSCGSDVAGPGGVTSVTVSPATDSVVVGGTATLQATVHGANGAILTNQKVFWNTENPEIATVSDQGVVTAVAPGTVRIAASAASRSGFSTVTVLDVPVASVTVTPSDTTVELGHTVTLHAVTRDANGAELTGRSVTWSTSAADVATVDGHGVVTGVAGGTAEITATSEGKRGNAMVAVLPPAASISISPALVALLVGQTTQLTATVRDASGNVINGAPVTWSSSDTTLATVSSTGVVKAIAPGFPNVTAKSGKVSATIQVGVFASSHRNDAIAVPRALP